MMQGFYWKFNITTINAITDLLKKQFLKEAGKYSPMIMPMTKGDF